MTTKDEALQMCLEYIETNAHERKFVRHAIKEALAAPVQNEQQPVQERWESEMRNELIALGFDTQCPESIGITLKRWRDGYAAQPAHLWLYFKVNHKGVVTGPFKTDSKDTAYGIDCIDQTQLTVPAAQRQYPQAERAAWVGLTQEDIDIAFDDTQEGGGFDEFAQAIEIKLREKNT